MLGRPSDLSQARVFSSGRSSSDRRETLSSCRPVHPGWLVASAVRAAATDDTDQTRFAAFMQLLRTAGALDRAASDALADLGLTAGAYGALLELAKNHPAGIAPSELARRLAVARRTATLYVDILSRHGWAERSAHPEDHRMVLARLTDAGLDLIDDLSESYQHRLAGLLGDLSPMQAERLRQLLCAVNVSDRSRDSRIVHDASID